MITVIIPTILKSDEEVFKYTLSNLDNCEVVSEIIIVNNTNGSIDFEQKKVRVISKGHNIYVNPAWEWGVSESKTDKIIIMNDDIICSPETINITSMLLDNPSIGLVSFKTINDVNIKEYNDIQQPKEIKIDGRFANIDNNKTGWFMGIRKKEWVPIPSQLKIWFGDDVIYNNIRKRGLKTVCVQSHIISHFESSSLKNGGEDIGKCIDADIRFYDGYRRRKE